MWEKATYRENQSSFINSCTWNELYPYSKHKQIFAGLSDRGRYFNDIYILTEYLRDIKKAAGKAETVSVLLNKGLYKNPVYNHRDGTL